MSYKVKAQGSACKRHVDQIKERLVRENVDIPRETSTTDISVSDSGVPHQEDLDSNEIEQTHQSRVTGDIKILHSKHNIVLAP